MYFHIVQNISNMPKTDILLKSCQNITTVVLKIKRAHFATKTYNNLAWEPAVTVISSHNSNKIGY